MTKMCVNCFYFFEGSDEGYCVKYSRSRHHLDPICKGFVEAEGKEIILG